MMTLIYKCVSLAFTAILFATARAQGRPACDSDLTANTKVDYYFTTPYQFCLDNNYVGVSSSPEGTSLTVRWKAATAGNILYIAQINATQPLHALQTNLQNSYEWNGCLPQGVSLSNGITFNFLLYNSSGWICSSDFFNVTTSGTCASRASSSAASVAAAASSANTLSSSLSLTAPSATSTFGFATSAAATAATSGATKSGAATSGAAASGAAASGAAASTGPSTDNGGGNGMSEGAKIGIGVGVGVGGLLAILGIAFFVIGRKRDKARTKTSAGTVPYSDQALYRNDGPPPSFEQSNYRSGTSEVHGNSAYMNNMSGYAPYKDAPPRAPVEIDNNRRGY